ncbi:hypothetical protein M0R04_05625 [Candidatus Dojkabacteria bacterium]|jgi:hypothetical protein|nr:hypothetical protein [Candidatus Dojkabacteria bacterium]
MTMHTEYIDCSSEHCFDDFVDWLCGYLPRNYSTNSVLWVKNGKKRVVKFITVENGWIMYWPKYKQTYVFPDDETGFEDLKLELIEAICQSFSKDEEVLKFMEQFGKKQDMNYYIYVRTVDVCNSITLGFYEIRTSVGNAWIAEFRHRQLAELACNALNKLEEEKKGK